MANKENPTRPFSIQNRGIRAPRIRCHNPGTSRRVRLLSSVTLAPPRYRSMPIIPSSPDSRLFVPAIPWRPPEEVAIPPIDPIWRRARSLIPVPIADYRYGYNIFPGDAYGPVPLYVDRDRPWVLRPIDLPPERRIHFYRNDVLDPRQHDFRVEVIRHPLQPSTITAPNPSTSTVNEPCPSTSAVATPRPATPPLPPAAATTCHPTPPLPPATAMPNPPVPPQTPAVTEPCPQSQPQPPVTAAPRRRRRSRLVIIG